MKWSMVKIQEDTNFLMKTFNYFHDSCIASMQYKSGAYVDKSNFYINPMSTERALSVIFHSRFKNGFAI